MKKKTLDLLPWYINGTLPPQEQRVVAELLEASPEIRQELRDWQAVARRVQTQPAVQPRREVWSAIQSRLAPAAPRPQYGMLTGLVFAIILLVGFWLAVRPGVVLEWSVTGETPQAFNIYRAAVGSDTFELIREIPASGSSTRYRYADALLLPLQSYVYRVEGVGAAGRLALSQSITTNPLAALPGQIAILLSSVILAYALILLLQNWPGTLDRNGRGAAV